MDRFQTIIDSSIRVFDSAYTDEVSQFFVEIIILILGIAVVARIFACFNRLKFFRFLANYLGFLDKSAPALLMTIGVLGTFTGILLGLLDFNVENIDESVPELLSGLNIAFTTSIFGIVAAVSLKLIQTVTPSPDKGVVGVTPEKIHTTLESIKTAIVDGAEQERTALQELRKSISAEDDSSLLTQVQKLRIDLKDGLGELKQEFWNFAKTMAENNSKALIEVLESVIRDFNTQLNEQFGDNFKQLNEAVAALLTWQENYRKHVETLQDEFTKVQQGILASEEAIRNISSHTESIPDTLQKLEKIVDNTHESIVDLNGHLDAVSGLRDKALQAFPTIDENLKQITDDLTNSINEVVRNTSDALSKQQESNNSLFHALDKIPKMVDERMTEFDERVKNELEKNIQVLASNLVSLSEKFVEDYTPLTNKLREVVRIAENK